ncbi:unnamed protein product [Ilex paraguariensis]|uniref:Uncharacterized protein n=2 Tax=Ilex paraguariensis TaxID=185542 RepID=A0ABC8RX80_9AQUA
METRSSNSCGWDFNGNPARKKAIGGEKQEGARGFGLIGSAYRASGDANGIGIVGSAHGAGLTIRGDRALMQREGGDGAGPGKLLGEREAMGSTTDGASCVVGDTRGGCHGADGALGRLAPLAVLALGLWDHNAPLAVWG